MDSKINHYFFYKVLLLFSTFVVIFFTKLHGYIDVPFIIVLFFFLFQGMQNKLSKLLIFLVGVLILFFIYSSFISIVYGANEIIWPLKFARTAIFFFLLYFLFIPLSKKYSYEQFSNIFVWFVVAHSLIIYLAITLPDFRTILYSLTGYLPRGPGWSRSPGLTISFNATAIVHVTALWFIVRSEKKNILSKLLLILLILPSLIFLGRSMAYLGLTFIISYLFITRPVKFLSGSLIGVLIVSVLGFSVSTVDSDSDSVLGKIHSNFNHAILPLMNIGADEGVDSYFSESLSSHIYFSDDWKVLLLGNSISGHMGKAGGKGETDSDLGLINSVNANGIPVTIAMYLFYCSFIYLSRKKDVWTVAFISVLSFALTLKETGFFVSHVTPLLLFVLYYQVFYDKKQWVIDNKALMIHGGDK